MLILVALMVAFIAFCVVSLFEPTKPSRSVEGIVVQRDYDAEVNGSGMGPSITGGGAGVAFVSVHEDEKWNLVVQSERGVESFQVDKELWVKADEGTKVIITPLIGNWFGSENDTTITLSSI